MKRLVWLLIVLSFSAVHAQNFAISKSLVPISIDNAHLVQHLASFGNGYITALAWSPNGASLAVGTSVNVDVYDLNAPDAPARRLLTTPKYISGLTYSPDGKFIAASTPDSLVLLNAQSGEQRGVFAGNSGVADDIVFSPDGNTLVWGGFPAVKIINVADALTSTPPPVTECLITIGSSAVNVRAGAGANFPKLGSLASGLTVAGVERVTAAEGYFWWRVSADSLPPDGGWVRADLVTTTGCDDLPVQVGTLIIQARSEVNWSFFLPRDVAVNFAEGWLATTNYGGKTDVIRLWDLTTAAPRGEIRTQFIPHILSPGLTDKTPFAEVIELSPDGKRLWAVGGTGEDSDGDLLRTWDLQTNQERILFQSHGSIWSATGSSDGKLIALGGSKYRPTPQNAIWLVEAESGKLLVTLPGDGLVEDVAFSPDGKRLAAASQGALQIWDVTKRAITTSFTAYKNGGFAATVSPNLQWAATGIVQNDLDEHVLLQELTTGETYKVGHFDQLFRLSFSPDSSIFAVADRQEISWWSVAKRQRLGGTNLKFAQAWESLNDYAFAWSADGRVLAFTAPQNRVEIWNIPANKRIASFVNDQTFWARSLALNADGTLVVTIGSDGKARVWDATTGIIRSTLRDAQKQGFSDALFHADGERLALGTNAGIEFWNLRLGARVSILNGVGGKLNADWTLVVSANEEQFRLYDATSGEVLVQLPSSHSQFLLGLLWAEGNRAIVTVGRDGTIGIFGVAS